ncbi:hypothetical protein [Aurantimonas coralicida]|uniref:hypothetical protein n=1 Tax=Aurantimonas coralicida TaxID=182270 RepID=UPI000400C3FB|nr:hypothetical protein [Aurantimonas coralicida]
MARFELIVGIEKLPNLQDIADLEDAGLDEPVKLAMAPYLPEIGMAWSEKVLRGAINRGELPAERIGRTIFVTRRGIIEWRNTCRVRPSPPISGSCPKSETMTARSGSTPLGTSKTADAALARAAALRMFEAPSRP